MIILLSKTSRMVKIATFLDIKLVKCQMLSRDPSTSKKFVQNLNELKILFCAFIRHMRSKIFVRILTNNQPATRNLTIKYLPMVPSNLEFFFFQIGTSRWYIDWSGKKSDHEFIEIAPFWSFCSMFSLNINSNCFAWCKNYESKNENFDPTVLLATFIRSTEWITNKWQTVTVFFS